MKNSQRLNINPIKISKSIKKKQIHHINRIMEDNRNQMNISIINE